MRTDAWDTGFVDIAGEQGLLGQVEGRTSACVLAWLRAQTPQFRAAIRFVAIDRRGLCRSDPHRRGWWVLTGGVLRPTVVRHSVSHVELGVGVIRR